MKEILSFVLIIFFVSGKAFGQKRSQYLTFLEVFLNFGPTLKTSGR
jgi:hypothetical protein